MIHSPPEAVYPRGLTYRIAATIVAAGSLALLFHFRQRLGTNLSGGLSLAMAAALLWFWRWEAGKIVQIHPEGVVLRTGASVRAMTWESVKEVRYRAFQSRGGGILGVLLQAMLRGLSRRGTGVDERAVSIHCVLRADGERPLVITSAWSRAGAAVEQILSRVNPRLLQEALDRVRTVGSAEFGPVQVRHDSVSRGNRVLRFAEIASYGLESGRFFAKKQGAWLSAIQVPVSKVPNVFVLVELLRHLGVPGIRRSDLTSATLGG